MSVNSVSMPDHDGFDQSWQKCIPTQDDVLHTKLRCVGYKVKSWIWHQ